VLAREAKLCVYCRAPLSLALSFDHRVPIARSGLHAISNLCVCCQRCNTLKGKLTTDEFTELLALLQRLHPAARQDLERRLLAGGVRYCRR